jgi:hypothetical protein
MDIVNFLDTDTGTGTDTDTDGLIIIIIIEIGTGETKNVEEINQGSIDSNKIKLKKTIHWFKNQHRLDNDQNEWFLVRMLG